MTFSITGFIIGAICAVIFFLVARALVTFDQSELIFGIVAFLIWGLLTFRWPAGRGIGGPGVRQ